MTHPVPPGYLEKKRRPARAGCGRVKGVDRPSIDVRTDAVRSSPPRVLRDALQRLPRALGLLRLDDARAARVRGSERWGQCREERRFASREKVVINVFSRLPRRSAGDGGAAKAIDPSGAVEGRGGARVETGAGARHPRGSSWRERSRHTSTRTRLVIFC